MEFLVLGPLQVLDSGRPVTVSAPRQRALLAVLLANALESLPAHYREVIILHHMDGLSIAEVAARMGRTYDSVRKIWVRSMIRLRHIMQDPT